MIKQIQLTDDRKGLIQSYYRKPVDFDNILLFSFVVADNEIDDMREKFSIKSLKSISRLIIGKSGVISIGSTSYNTLSRVIESRIDIADDKLSSDGFPYISVVCVAYIICNENTKDICDKIKNREISEVNIGASITNYCLKQNHKVIEDVSDIYEWSFKYPEIKKCLYCSKPDDKSKSKKSLIGYTDKDCHMYLRTGVDIPTVMVVSKYDRKYNCDTIVGQYVMKYCPECGRKLTENKTNDHQYFYM